MRTLATVAGPIAIVTGGVVLAGWLAGAPQLTNPFPGVAMKANTALALAALGASLWLLAPEPVRPARRAVGLALGAAVAALGLLSLLEYALPAKLAIDELLVREPAGLAGTLPPGRMAPNTALALALDGAALALVGTGSPRGQRAAHHLAIAACFIAFIALLIAAFHPQLGLDTPPWEQMASLTAGALILLSAGILGARPALGVVAIMTHEGSGGAMARRLLPAAFAVPALMGWVRLRGQQAGLYDTGAGVAITVVLTTALFSAFVVLSAASMNRREVELRRAKETAEATSRELEAFSYSVSHDLRAPLRSIDGFSQALEEDLGQALPADALASLHRVRSAAQRMGQLIDDLLSLSQVARHELRLKSVDLSALARTVAARLADGPERRDVRFLIAEGLTARCDENLAAVVLENLLGNAWKFTSQRPGATIEVGALADRGAQAVFVRDDGAGFDMQFAHKLFGAFQRLHGAAEFEGTGIGLATVQRIVHRHGGRVWAEGRVGEGATFYFTLSPDP